MSATIEVQDEQLVSAPEASRLFMSRRSELRLILTPRYNTFGAGGQKVGESPGQIVAFKDGVLRLPLEGQVRLEDGRRVEAAEIVEALDGHRLKGDVNEGFWAVDPVAPAPSAQDIKTLVRLAQMADVDGLTAFIEQERAGWNRADLLESAEEALESSRAAAMELERVEKERAAQAEAEKKAKAEAAAKAKAEAAKQQQGS